MGEATGSGAIVAWDHATCTLILSFKGGMDLITKTIANHQGHGLAMVQPFYLHQLAQGGRDARVLIQFDTTLELMHADIEAAIQRLKGGRPRTIAVSGFCCAGGLAICAAPWLALRYPSADVSCITFGSPRVGNAAFTHMFNWLVGLAYRTVYRFDPFPSMPSPHLLNIDLYGVGSDIFFDGKHAQRLRKPLQLRHSLTDHDAQQYVRALEAAATAADAAAVPRTAGGQAVLVAPEVAKNQAELDARGDCTGEEL